MKKIEGEYSWLRKSMAFACAFLIFNTKSFANPRSYSRSQWRLVAVVWLSRVRGQKDIREPNIIIDNRVIIIIKYKHNKQKQ